MNKINIRNFEQFFLELIKSDSGIFSREFFLFLQER